MNTNSIGSLQHDGEVVLSSLILSLSDHDRVADPAFLSSLLGD